LVSAIQLVTLLTLSVYYLIKKPELVWRKEPQWATALVLMGIIGFVAAPLFTIVGLSYVTGTVAGLFAGLSSTLVMVLAWMILREKPTVIQIFGLAIAFAGATIFLNNQLFSGALGGILLIFLAEISYALNTVLIRLLSREPGKEAFTLAWYGSLIGTICLLPIGLMSGDLPLAFTGLRLWIVVLIGIIFALAGLMWNTALDKLKAIEVAILQNTMLIQISFLSVVFLHEKIALQHILGGIIVLIGAYLVESRLLLRSKKYGT